MGIDLIAESYIKDLVNLLMDSSAINIILETDIEG